MLHETQIILRPVVTEKSTWEAESRKRYAFEVHARATKPQIRQAIEKLYNVRVERVSTQNRTGKYKRTRWGTFRTTRPKKAVVQLHPEDTINLF
jgi:large subunit ribosomal protein L23